MYLSNFQLKCFIVLILFSPAFFVAGRSIYVFEIVTLVYLFLSLLINQAFKKRSAALYVYMFFAAVILSAQGLIYSQIFGLELIRMSLAFATIFIVRAKDLDVDELINFTMAVACIVAFIGIVQTLDGLIFSNVTGLNSLLSAVYPYPGELTGSAANKAGPYQLKLSSAWGSTSTFDGHPILFSDFLVLAAVVSIYFKRSLGLFVIVIALVTTYTRGAWVATFFAILFPFLFLWKRFSKWDFLKLLVLLGIVSFAVYSVEPVRDYVQFRFLNTLASFDLISGYDVGRLGDPRTETVWPEFIQVLSASGIPGYMFGVPSNVPTDSGYLTIINSSGLVGLLLMISFFLYIYRFMVADKPFVALLYSTLSVLMIVHPVFQGYKSLYFLIALLLIVRKEDKNHAR